jgi:pyruvate kinase
MKKTILTVGPSFIYDNILKENHNEMYIYRINGAHGTIKDIEKYVHMIREQVPNADILLDLPGNKVRTANLMDPITLKKGESFFLSYNQTNFKEYYKYLKIGDIVYANDSIFKFEVKSIKDGFIEFISFSDGILLNNKGMHVRGINEKLPFLFEKDYELINLANKMNVSFVGLSFVRDVEDIKLAKSLIKNSKLIVKIETKLAVNNINNILLENDYFLIDRGDLSTEIGLVNLSKYQRYIIEKVLSKNKNLFLATQFLKNMELNPIPSIAEIIDLVNTLKQGITGIQLSEETAVGKYPLECLKILDDAYKSIEQESI